MKNSDRQLVDNLRDFMETTKDRLQGLRDEINDRDKKLEEESMLRLRLEDRLKAVDMYDDSSVNQELKQRLPFANSAEDSNYAARRKAGKPPRARRKHDRRRSVEKDYTSDSELSSPINQRHKRKGHQHHSQVSPGTILVASADDLRNSGAPILYRPMLPSELQSLPNASFTSLLQPVSSLPAIPTAVAASQMQSSTPKANQMNPTAPQVQLPSEPNQSISGATLNRPGLSDVDLARQVSLLLAELDAAREANRKLSDELDVSTRELDTVKMQRDMKAAQLNAEMSERLTAAVAEVHGAQKERETAMMARIRLANEERDDALSKLRKLQKSGVTMEIGSGDLSRQSSDSIRSPTTAGGGGTVDDLVKLLARRSDSGLLSTKEGNKAHSSLVTAVRNMASQRQDITGKQMQQILNERDSAVEQARNLEMELLETKKQNSKIGPAKQREANLQKQLNSAVDERDAAVKKLQKMENELGKLRVYHSLHKSLNDQWTAGQDQLNNTLQTLEANLKQRDGLVATQAKENNRLAAQMKAVLVEKQQLVTELEKAKNSQKSAEKECARLERVVAVLRRKLANADSNISTIDPEISTVSG